MIVVTGAAGFIGSNIVHSLNQAGQTAVAVCDLFGHEEKWRNLASSVFHASVQPADLLTWLRARNDVTAVIHMGAISATTATDADLVMKSNFTYSVDLLDHCTERGIQLVYASSAAVYGAGEQGFVDNTDPDKIAALRPLNLYGWSKKQFDFVVADRLACRLPMPPACAGLRFFNVFGPNEYHKGDMRSIVAKLAEPIARGERVTLFKSHRKGIADGDQRRDFIYVKDAVRMTLAVLDARLSGIFNVGTGYARSFRELIEAEFNSFGRSPAIDYVDMPDNIRDQYQYFTEAKLENLELAIGTQACNKLENSVEDYVSAYLRCSNYR